jgi:DNA-binding beta-propeller fold protein YncE
MRATVNRPAAALRLLRRSAAPCAAAALALAPACRDATSPKPLVEISVAVDSIVGPTIAQDTAGPELTCDLYLRADGRGPASGRAIWKGATVRWFLGQDRRTPVDSIVMPASDVQAWWGTPYLTPGESRRARWTLHSSLPFEGVAEFLYAPAAGEASATASARFACGPVVDSTTLPPAILTISVTRPPAGLQPGDTLDVTFMAYGPAGLLKTTAAVTSPCSSSVAFWEDLRTTVVRTAHIPLPVTCEFGVPLTVTAGVIDGATRSSSRVVYTDLALVDRTPPAVHTRFFRPDSAGVPTETFAGQFFVDDTLRLQAYADDNHGLSAVVWELRPAGYRDSALVSGPSAAPILRIALRPEFVGPAQLRLWARDAAGLESDTIVSLADSLIIYPSVPRPTHTVSVYGHITDFSLDARRGVVYALVMGLESVIALSPVTGLETASVPVGDYPLELDPTAGGDSLIVLLPNRRALGIVDLRDLSRPPTFVPLAALDSASGETPRHLRVTSSGKVFISTWGTGASHFRLLEVDLGTGVQRFRTDAGDGGHIGEGLLAPSLDRSVLVLNGGSNLAQRYEAATDRFGPRTSFTSYYGLPQVDLTGSHVAVGLEVYDASLQFLRTVRSMGPGSVQVATISADGAFVLQAVYPAGLLRSRVSDGALVDRTPLPFVVDRLSRSADGTMLAALLSGGGMLTFIDLR